MSQIRQNKQAAQIDPSAGFVSAFETLGYEGPARVAAAGELLALPLVALGCLLPQSRLLRALALDGLAPAALADLDASGQLLNGVQKRTNGVSTNGVPICQNSLLLQRPH